MVNGCVSVLIIVAFPTSEQVQQQIEKMEHQQSELEDLKLKFQEPEAARENQRGEIESLKKQGERLFGCEFVELSWLSCYRVTCLFCFWVVYEVTSQVMLGCNMHMNLLVFGQVISGYNKYSVKWPGVLNEYIVLN